MDYVYIGKIVNTHGIKGELRLRSNFELKDQVFVPGKKIYIGDCYVEEEITSYRHHKEFDMICLKNYNNINQVLKFLKMKVYVKRSDLNINNYLIDDLLGMEVKLNDECLGKVINIFTNGNNLLLVKGTKEFYIPLVNEYINKVDTQNKIIYVNNNTKGLM